MSAYPLLQHTDPSTLTRKDFTPGNEVRWCPGCEDYSILAAVQKFLPSLGIPKENYVFVSGIGCSSRFPYYMDTYGMHTIHGRAPAVATGLKVTRPELSVWLVTGDGDALAIGGNHFMHLLRRNVDIKVLLFNNRIYGLTKGQYSPTSELGIKTKSTPDGSADYPVDPIALSLGAGATFVARALASDMAGMTEVLRRAAMHKGTAMVELYQNCVIFNDGTFDGVTDSQTRDEHQLRLVHGEALRFGKDKSKGVVMDRHGRPTVVNIADASEDRLLVHDEQSETLAYALSRLALPEFPVPLGVFRAVSKPTYDEMVREKVDRARSKRSVNVQSLLDSGETWTVG